MIHYVYTKFRHWQTFVELIWNDPFESLFLVSCILNMMTIIMQLLKYGCTSTLVHLLCARTCSFVMRV